MEGRKGKVEGWQSRQARAITEGNVGTGCNRGGALSVVEARAQDR